MPLIDIRKLPIFARNRRGVVPEPGGSGTTKFLREDATWQVPAGGSGAPSTAEYLVAVADAGLSAERVATDTTSITWDFTVAGQAKANVADLYLLNTGDIGTGVYDFGGATSLALPNAASGTTVDAAGEITIVTTATYDGSVQAYGSAEFRLSPNRWNAITIENPTNAEDSTIVYTANAITMRAMRAVLVGSATPSVTWTIRFASDRSAAGTEVVTGGTTTTSTTTGSSVGPSFSDGTIPAGNFIWLETTAKSGTVLELHVTLFYTIDPV